MPWQILTAYSANARVLPLSSMCRAVSPMSASTLNCVRKRLVASSVFSFLSIEARTDSLLCFSISICVVLYRNVIFKWPVIFLFLPIQFVPMSWKEILCIFVSFLTGSFRIFFFPLECCPLNVLFVFFCYVIHYSPIDEQVLPAFLY